MKSLVTTLLTLALIIPSYSGGCGAVAAGQQGEQKLGISTAEVALDIVARDRKGRPVTDLTPDDFEVFEDGVKQSVESFRLIRRGPAGNPAGAEENAPPNTRPGSTGRPVPVEKRTDPDVGVSVVALVFDRLSPDARKRAHDAALSYLGEETTLNSFVGVFAINLSLVPLQNYTTDISLVKKAVERAGSLASSTFEGARTPAGFAEQSAQREAAASAGIAAAGAAGAAGNSAAAGAAASAGAAAAVDQQFAEMQRRTDETFEVLQRDQQGYATTNGLLAIVNSMRRLPGRKAVIFFSEGLAIPPNVQQHFRSVVNSA